MDARVLAEWTPPHDVQWRRPETARWLTGTAIAGWFGYFLVLAATWMSPRHRGDQVAPPPSHGSSTLPSSDGHLAHAMTSSPPAIAWLIPDQLWIVVMWLPMIAMMAPWIRYNVRFVATRSPQRRRVTSGLEIAAAWAIVWLVALVPIGLVTELLTVGLGDSWAIVVAVAVAAAWQLTPWKRRALSRCDRTLAPPLAPKAARVACLALGARLGWWCVVSDWALMFVMGVAHHSVPVVVGLLAVSWFERFRLPHHDRRSAQTGVAVAVCGAAAVTLAFAQG